MLLVGLGNPGASYAKNRHNVGFMALDAIADAYHAPSWVKKFQGLWTEAASLQDDKVYLLKPQTFMNLSGESVLAAAGFYKIPPSGIIVLHDELDLPLGKIRVKQGGGDGGHNGLKSITRHLGPDYWRVRIGVGHPGDKERVTGHVLGDFAKEERPLQEKVLEAIVEALPLLLAQDDSGFMNKIALLLQGARAI